jgi:hypothetical protein
MVGVILPLKPFFPVSTNKTNKTPYAFPFVAHFAFDGNHGWDVLPRWVVHMHGTLQALPPGRSSRLRAYGVIHVLYRP